MNKDINEWSSNYAACHVDANVTSDTTISTDSSLSVGHEDSQISTPTQSIPFDLY